MHQVCRVFPSKRGEMGALEQKHTHTQTQMQYPVRFWLAHSSRRPHISPLPGDVPTTSPPPCSGPPAAAGADADASPPPGSAAATAPGTRRGTPRAKSGGPWWSCRSAANPARNESRVGGVHLFCGFLIEGEPKESQQKNRAAFRCTEPQKHERHQTTPFFASAPFWV